MFIEELLYLWESETNEDWTQEWRDELSADKEALVEGWGDNFFIGLARMIQDSRAKTVVCHNAILGRFAMTCCVEHITFLGLVSAGNSFAAFDNRS